LLDIRAGAQYIGMSERWLYRNYSLMAHIRIGHGARPRILFRRSDLDQFVAAHRITPSQG
jgi:predicted DNA-binding transcriptional regulator AlpA